MAADPLHERLLRQLEGPWLTSAMRETTAALRVVVERHKPVPCNWSRCRAPDTHRTCSACGAVVNFPCPDIQAIAREMGVDGG